MRSIRGIYFYAVAFISLEVVMWGVIGLLRGIFSSQLVDTGDALARALSLIVVGVPIFLFHWLWSQRAAAKDEEERSAGLRAIFLYAVLLATLVPVVQNTLALINRLILGAANISTSRAFLGGFQTWQDNLIAILINSVIALYFWNILTGVWKSLTNFDTFADVRRLYRYIWVLYALFMVVFGAQQILRYIFYLPLPKYLLGDLGRGLFANGLALLLIGTPLWAYTWRICQNALPAAAEKASNLRLGVLYLLSLGGVIIVLSTSGALLNVILGWVFGEAMDVFEFIQEIRGPISLGVPLAAVWVYHSGWLKHQIQSDSDGIRRAAKQRLFSYILSGLGLAAAFIGVAMVFSFSIELLTSTAIWGDSLRTRLTAALSSLIVGLPVWLLNWWPMQEQATTENEIGDHARRSAIRRIYLYLALFIGVIGGMVSAVGLVFQLVDALLSRDLPGDFWPNLFDAAQLFLLFSVLLIYHLSVIRHDNTRAGQTLETRQRKFPIMLIDSGDDNFVKLVTEAMGKHAADVPLIVQAANKSIAKDAGVQAVLLQTSLVLDPPESLRKWLKSFSGEKIVVGAAGSGWVMSALTPDQAAQSARQVAEGEEVRLSQTSSIWRLVQIVAVAILGLQILLILMIIGFNF
ncbi:MAG: DUF5671 domain-containing protein [Anaerolineae bacterium]|nr:DUF5671 domain-containing protein [Anaerolineae bacterium]MDK1081942.1 DUF5671 domain-containing protein [Anaerolineae bacterium]